MKKTKKDSLPILDLSLAELVAYLVIGLAAGFIVGYGFTKMVQTMM